MEETFRVETAVSQNVSLNYSANESIFTLELLKHNVVYIDSFIYSCGDNVQRLIRKCFGKTRQTEAALKSCTEVVTHKPVPLMERKY